MAQNYRGDGNTIDFGGVSQTGVTITAGSMVWVNPLTALGVMPFTSVAATALAESSGFFGVLAETLTGPRTGVTIHRKGIFQFVTNAAATAAAVVVGRPVWAVTHDTVRGFGTTAAALTGVHPIGMCVFLPDGPDTSAASVRCHVDIFPDRTLPLYLTDADTSATAVFT